MRFSKPYDLPATKPEFDVLLVDTVGRPFNESFLANHGMGGSEFQAVMLLEELAKRGYRCGCINNGPFASVSSNGVKYYPMADLKLGIIRPKTNILIGMRTGNLPDGIEFGTCIFWIHDIPDQRLKTVHEYLVQMQDARAVCVSKWQQSKCPPGWDTCSEVIPNMIPDWVYEHAGQKRDSNKFVYASAAMKGLDATLEVWSALKKKHRSLKKARLEVLSPGYDSPSDAIKNAKGVTFRGSLPFADVVHEIATSRALFYVNTLPETFCIVGAMCEAVGTPPLILCVNDTGALPNTLSATVCTDGDRFENRLIDDEYLSEEPKDYRASTVVPQWIKFLGLEEKNEAEPVSVPARACNFRSSYQAAAITRTRRS
jgi:hypothetical protein